MPQLAGRRWPKGRRLWSDFRYTSNTVFDSFPWPQTSASDAHVVEDDTVKLREFTYGSRTLEVHAKNSASRNTWSVEVLDAGQRTIGVFYTAITETVADGKRHGIDILQEMGATAE